MRRFFLDRKYRVPRVWSNDELAKFAYLFTGAVVNVSAWKDEDKEGTHYRDYFKNACSYTVTNYKAEARGWQGVDGEIFLNLEATLPKDMNQRFDVVFNHTVLEHIYEVRTAFRNLCEMSKDIVILVVPFLQQMHSNYGDYWRFSPLTLERMFEDNGMTLLYCSFNTHKLASVYLFAIASKHSERWAGKIPLQTTHVDPSSPLDGLESFVGCHAIPNRLYALRKVLGRIVRFLGWRRDADASAQ